MPGTDQRSPYPRRGPIRLVRKLLVFSPSLLIPYLVNTIRNLYELSRPGATNNLSDIQILLMVLHPIVFSGDGGSISGSVVMIFMLPLPVILAAYVWARQDQALEDAADKNRLIITTAQNMSETVIIEMDRYIAAAEATTAAVPIKVERVWGSDLPRTQPLIGRKKQLEQVTNWLRQAQDVSVVAVQGLPSVGKTALAAEAVAELVNDATTFPGGAAWISCAELQGQDGLSQLWTRIARALAAGDMTSLSDYADTRAALHATLADRSRPRVLLTLDNVEPGLDISVVLDTISGGRATLLLTSRDVIAPDRVQRLELEPLAEEYATTLFIRRLKQVDNSRPWPSESQAVDTLVPLLGGLPLAIELVASYAGLQMRTLDAVTNEIRSGGLTSAPLQGLSAQFDRSWRVLSESQQRLFAGLSELAGPSFPTDAALAVGYVAIQLGNTRGTIDHRRVTGDLSALIGSNLLAPLPGDRLRLHPLLREFAEVRLAGMPVNTSMRLGAAALEYWQQLARQHHGNQERDMNALEVEANAFMGALQWAHLHDRREEVIELVGTLGQVWDMRGRHEELQQMLEWAISAAEGLHDEAAECEMTLRLARLQVKVGQPQLASTNFAAAEAMAIRRHDHEAHITALRGLAAEDRNLTKYTRARERLQHALEIATENVHRNNLEREIHHELAVVDFEGRWFAEAFAEFDSALSIAQTISDSSAVALERDWLTRLHAEHPEL